MSTPIEEFFVGLGFKIDSKGFNAFTGGVFKATTMTQKLGFAAVQTAIAVEKMTVKVARQFEKLYYAAEIANTSVSSLQAWEYAAQQIGISAAEAEGMVKNLGTAMRANPGLEALMNGLGVRTRTNTGELRQTTELMHDLVGQLMKMGPGNFYLQSAYASIFGISPDELKLMEDHYGEAEAAAEKFATKQRAAGIDADALAKKSREFDNDLRALGGSLEIAGEKIAQIFMPTLDEVTTGLTGIVDQFTGAKVATDAWIVSLKELGRVEVKGGSAIISLLEDDPELPEIPEGGEDAKTTASLMRAIMSMGYPKAAAAGIAANLMDESSGNPNADNGTHYGLAQWDLSRQADFAKWAGHGIKGSSYAEQLAFLNYELTYGKYKATGDRIRKSDAYGAGSLTSYEYEKPGGGPPGLLAMHRGMQSMEAFDAYNLGAAGRGGGVNINQKTDIHVNGGAAPAATGSAIATLQDSVNSRMVRHAASATR